MQKKKIITAIVPLVFIAIIAAFWWQSDRNGSDESTLHLYGNVDIREAQLAFNSSEHVFEIRVQEGDRVTKGQLLARLHTELLDAQLAEAEAALRAQQQTLAKLEAGSRPEEIRKGQAEFNATRATAKATSDSYNRIARLLEKKMASPEDVEKAYSLADVAKAQMEASKQALALLQVGPRKEDIAVARAQLAATEARLELAQQQAVLGAFLFLVPAVILSGFSTPIANMPEAVQWLTYLDPLRYFLVIVRGVTLEGNSYALLINQYWPMALIGVVTLALAGWLFRHRMY
ncbi:MAG: ABC transporter permease [Marinobacter sp.]|uniref:ABC transporter permease n=1 Tax=Marinobacter sp. TaxID=50741 RepID=UPI001B68359B|nr:ABC transporter permease [Marinobacter sp.]MBQ0747173.1 ABC transporter permease [Marinobacter sp.]MBQ0814689.1 ABC transporter permease [Marinobacter sp.]